jgi:hypothetical protein
LNDGAPHWRHGVVLRHDDAEALIRAESDRPELHVFVLGGKEETRGVLVAMVRRELSLLHAEFKMQPVEELELSGEEERWISVKALRDVEGGKSKQQTLAVLPEGTARVMLGRPRVLRCKRPAQDDPATLDALLQLVPERARNLCQRAARAFMTHWPGQEQDTVAARTEGFTGASGRGGALRMTRSRHHLSAARARHA